MITVCWNELVSLYARFVDRCLLGLTVAVVVFVCFLENKVLLRPTTNDPRYRTFVNGQLVTEAVELRQVFFSVFYISVILVWMMIVMMMMMMW